MQVHHFLENAARQYPDKKAAWYQNRWSTFSEINSKAAKLCSHLKKNNIKPGDRVAIMLENSIDYIIAYFGILKAGAVVVGLNPTLSGPFLLYRLNNSGSKTVIISKKVIPKLLPVIKKLDNSVNYILTDVRKNDNHNGLASTTFETIFQNEEESEAVRTIDLDLAEIVYTSGSTGKPKGVMLTHLNLVSNQRSIVKYLKLTEQDRVMVILPFYYIYGKSLLLTHFLAGGSVVIDNRFTYPNLVLDTMQKTGVTGFSGVPSTFSILLNRSNLRKTKIETLRYVTQAGGAMAPALQEEVVEVFAPAVLYVMYGATEAAPRLSYVEPEILPKKYGSIGIPVDNVDLKILDAEGNQLPPGESGEIAARGSNMMKGYWKDPKATENVFINDYYLTGDLGRQDEDGYFYVIGRKKDFIKAKGYKVSAKMVEETIMEMDEVHEVAVIGVDDEDMGEAVKAFIIPDNKADIKAEHIKNYLRDKLAQHEIPKYIKFVEKLPKNESGKILKTELS